ncbi:inner membrane protein [Escherichia coli]|uniref:Queuosine precursor transporter n=1 Tax=Escherichia coli TaxID=562 RepID=A0A376TYH7_ECOLX|nr:inner membrane protein [Escherichia coli]
MIPALLISYVISSLFYMGSWQGFGALAHFNLFVARIATASSWPTRWGKSSTCTFLTACVKVAAGGWHRQRPHCSVTSVTPLAFFFIAFWRSPDAFMAEHWMEIALVDYCFKVLISIVFFLPMYGVLLNMLLKRLADKSEINALQAS